MCNTPQTTLVLPPEVKLMDKLADNAVHDCDISLGGPSRMPILTFNTAKANPNMDLGLSALQFLFRSDLIFLFLFYFWFIVYSQGGKVPLELGLMAHGSQLSVVGLHTGCDILEYEFPKRTCIYINKYGVYSDHIDNIGHTSGD